MTLNDHHIISYCWLIVKKKLVFMLITSRFYFFVCLMASDVTERQALISTDWNVIIQSKSIKWYDYKSFELYVLICLFSLMVMIFFFTSLVVYCIVFTIILMIWKLWHSFANVSFYFSFSLPFYMYVLRPFLPLWWLRHETLDPVND